MIATGTILMQRDTPHPMCFRLSEDPEASAWMTVTHGFTTHALDNELSLEKWIFFYGAGDIKTGAFGFDRPKMVRAALERMILTVERQQCNCLEIDEVTHRSFLGLQHISISAHARHIQRGAHSIQRKGAQFMNWEQIESTWQDTVGSAKAHWGKIEENDWQTINGTREQLVSAVQKRYGVTKAEAEAQVESWAAALQDIGASRKAL